MEKHVSHELRIAIEPRPLTVGQVRAILEKLKVPDDTVIKSVDGNSWRVIKQLSFCRRAKEVSIW